MATPRTVSTGTNGAQAATAALTTAAFHANREPYAYRAGDSKEVTNAVNSHALVTFSNLFNGIREGRPRTKLIQDPAVKAVENAKERVFNALKAGRDKKAAKASFAFGKALWDFHLYGSAQDAYLFGAALRAGLAKNGSLDLSDTAVRGALFAELERAHLIENVDTSGSPLALGDGWPIFKRFLGGNEYGTFSQMLVGTGLVMKTFSLVRANIPSPDGGGAEYLVSKKAVRAMVRKELSSLKAMRKEGIPVVGIHHVGDLVYLRDYVPGAILAAIDHPLIGLTMQQRLDAKLRWYERALQITGAGMWEGATEREMQGSLVYSLEKRDWLVIDTLSTARQ
jgi:hypothetical protein